METRRVGTGGRDDAEPCPNCKTIELVGSGIDLNGQDLHGLDLSNLDFTGADLTGTDLTGADLTGANLTRALLKSARMDRIIPSPAGPAAYWDEPPPDECAGSEGDAPPRVRALLKMRHRPEGLVLPPRRARAPHAARRAAARRRPATRYGRR